MEWVKHLLFINQSKPAKEKFMEVSEAKIFMLMPFFLAVALPVGAMLCLKLNWLLPIESLFIVVIGAWILNTIWFLFSDGQNTSNAHFFVNTLLCIGSVPILGSYIFIHPIYSLVFLVTAAFCLVLLLGLTDVLKKNWYTILKLRWFFFALLLICYGINLCYESGYYDMSYLIVKPIVYALELYIVSSFTIVGLINFKKELETFYDEQEAMTYEECGRIYDVWDKKGGRLFVVKTFVGVVINFMMLLVVFSRLGLFVLVEYIW